MSSEYSADNITVLEGLEAVRKRPGMYIGTTGSDGLQHLIVEVFDNSRDEAMGGFADEIEISFLENDTIRIADNGRGIPVDTHKKTGLSALETIMTTLHAGGKFGEGGYKVSGGLHGVGISVVNALSEYTKVVVHRDNALYEQTYERGKSKSKIKKSGKSDKTGTIVYFKADSQIFDKTSFDFKKTVDQMRQQSFLVKNLRIRIIDARDGGIDIDDEKLFLRDQGVDKKSMTFMFEGGISSLVRHLNENFKPIHQNIFYCERSVDNVDVEIALQYIDDIQSRISPFANNIYNTEGGTHITGFKTALTRSINSYAKNKKLLKDDSFSGEDVLEGLTAVVTVKIPEIQFEGQTKSKLGSVEARTAVETIFGEAFSSFLEENPNSSKAIISKASLAYQARKAAKAAKDSVLRKGALEGMTLPGKLTDCQVKSPDEAELFIVEGESAGGTAKQGRDRRTQAILPLKGKILNAERFRLDRVVMSEEIKAITIALGTAIGDSFDSDKLRYGKIIIATDADVDGSHIRTLLLTLFYRYFLPLVENGNIYFAKPPLFKVQKGKEVNYAYSDEERDKFVGNDESKVFVQRYKGLGEMNYKELWETTMNPENRILNKVTVKDSKEANEIFDMLMGPEVPPRKDFIQRNAKYANIDL